MLKLETLTNVAIFSVTIFFGMMFFVAYGLTAPLLFLLGVSLIIGLIELGRFFSNKGI